MWQHAATFPDNIRRHYTERFDGILNLVRLCTNSLRMVEDRNM